MVIRLDLRSLRLKESKHRLRIFSYNVIGKQISCCESRQSVRLFNVTTVGGESKIAALACIAYLIVALILFYALKNCLRAKRKFVFQRPTLVPPLFRFQNSSLVKGLKS